MSPEIVLTPTAKDTLLSSITFIRQKWGGKPAEKVAERVWCVLDVITRKPYFFKVRQQNNVRRALITTHISVFYRVHQNCIEVLFFIDDRMEMGVEAQYFASPVHDDLALLNLSARGVHI